MWFNIMAKLNFILSTKELRKDLVFGEKFVVGVPDRLPCRMGSDPAHRFKSEIRRRNYLSISCRDLGT